MENNLQKQNVITVREVGSPTGGSNHSDAPMLELGLLVGLIVLVGLAALFKKRSQSPMEHKEQGHGK